MVTEFLFRFRCDGTLVDCASRVFGVVIAIAIAFSPGCSGGAISPPATELVPVGGTVTYQRAPLPRALILFIPLDETQAAARGMTNRVGRYTLEQNNGRSGIAVGGYKVAFRVLSVKKSNESDGSYWQRLGDPKTTPYQVDVSADKMTFDFDLRLPDR